MTPCIQLAAASEALDAEVHFERGEAEVWLAEAPNSPELDAAVEASAHNTLNNHLNVLANRDERWDEGAPLQVFAPLRVCTLFGSENVLADE